MALQNSQYDALMRYYQRLQFRNKHEQDARIAEAQARIPRLALIDQEIAAISVKKARILLGDKNATDFDLNEQIQALSRERTDLLKANGYPEDYLKMHYTCPLCQDTGYVDNRKCICFRRAISEHLYTQSNISQLRCIFSGLLSGRYGKRSHRTDRPAECRNRIAALKRFRSEL